MANSAQEIGAAQRAIWSLHKDDILSAWDQLRRDDAVGLEVAIGFIDKSTDGQGRVDYTSL
jgi:hypothetical protein